MLIDLRLRRSWKILECVAYTNCDSLLWTDRYAFACCTSLDWPVSIRGEYSSWFWLYWLILNTLGNRNKCCPLWLFLESGIFFLCLRSVAILLQKNRGIHLLYELNRSLTIRWRSSRVLWWQHHLIIVSWSKWIEVAHCSGRDICSQRLR